MTYLKAYVGTLVAFLAIDAVWLAFIANDFYKAHIGHLLSPEPNFGAAALFYVFYLAGIVFLAVRPGLAARSLRVALLHGAVLGFVAYGTYDFTNFATLQDWPPLVVAVDLVWGTFLTGFAAAAGYLAARPRG